MSGDESMRTIQMSSLPGQLHIESPLRSEADLSTSPVPSELIVANLGVFLHSEPLRRRSVLFDLLGQLHLEGECLVRAHDSRISHPPNALAHSALEAARLSTLYHYSFPFQAAGNSALANAATLRK